MRVFRLKSGRRLSSDKPGVAAMHPFLDFAGPGVRLAL